ncbi:hypothetical protein CPB85DRAFT_1282065 [Mucidula mucida]|nr:hypothetical protein CPB85DRAFT_1282065 [Mucidula mucida]
MVIASVLFTRPGSHRHPACTENYASTSSWTPEIFVKQETSPQMSLHLPINAHHFHIPVEQDEYDVYNQSTWPREYNVSAAPQFVAELGAVSECWSPYTDALTPELQYSSPSASETSNNVFDMQFGQSLQSTHYEHSLHRFSSEISSTPPLSPKPVAAPAKQSATVGDDSSRRRHPCLIPGCLRRFTSQYTLKVHMQAHKPKPRVSFLCTLGCGERFSRQHDRLRHEVAKHNKVCEFSCDACGRFFSTAKTLGNHKCPLAQGGTRWVHQ